MILVIFFIHFLWNYSSAHEEADPTQIITPRIVGGNEANSGEWPWIAALVRPDASSNYEGQFCGGSLIHPNWVVTAGHCVYYKSPANIIVLLGVHNLKDDIGEQIGVNRIIIHPSYNNWTLDFDIALLELEHKVSFETILTASDNLSLEGKLAYTMGWGKTDYNDYYSSDTLQEVVIPIVSNNTCNDAFNSYNPSLYNDNITESMVCAGFAEGGKDACIGDSGGPLVIWHENKWRLTGIVSWGNGCAQPGLYGVYTRVPQMNSFIYQYVPTSLIAGDLNQNGRLGLEDVIGILQMVAGVRPKTLIYPLPGDYDGDGEHTIKDVIKILKVLTNNSSK